MLSPNLLTNDIGHICKILNKDSRLFATHSLTYFNENAFLSTWVLIKIRETSQLLSTTGCSAEKTLILIYILWTSIFIIIVKKPFKKTLYLLHEILAWKKIHFSELLINDLFFTNFKYSKVMVSTEHPVVLQLLKL